MAGQRWIVQYEHPRGGRGPGHGLTFDVPGTDAINALISARALNGCKGCRIAWVRRQAEALGEAPVPVFLGLPAGWV